MGDPWVEGRFTTSNIIQVLMRIYTIIDDHQPGFILY
jgi:hypothetical protein